MDEDVILIDNRNAARLMPGVFQQRPGQRPPMFVQAAQPPMYVQQSAPQSAVVYVRDPATGALVREQAGGAAPTAAPASKLSKLGTGALLDIGAQILAAMMPLPAVPPVTGDVAKDVRNAQLQDAALGLAWKRHEQIKTIGALLGRLV